jgi:hypothetical protein
MGARLRTRIFVYTKTYLARKTDATVFAILCNLLQQLQFPATVCKHCDFLQLCATRFYSDVFGQLSFLVTARGSMLKILSSFPANKRKKE